MEGTGHETTDVNWNTEKSGNFLQQNWSNTTTGCQEAAILALKDIQALKMWVDKTLSKLVVSDAHSAAGWMWSKICCNSYYLGFLSSANFTAIKAAAFKGKRKPSSRFPLVAKYDLAA